MKKRTAALLLCLISILNLICVPAFAKSSSDSELTVTEQRAAAFMVDMGIWNRAKDGEELSEVVSRGEWARALSILIDSTSSYNNDTYYFKDCKDDVYSNSLASLGIINGVEDGKFMPDNAATVKTAYITAFRVSGFERYIELLGNSDYDYASLADKLELTVKNNINSDLTWRDAMVLLYQTGNVNTYDITAAVGDKAIFRQNKDKTVLTEWRNIYRKDKVRVTANRFTSLTSSEGAVRDDQLMIGDTVYTVKSKNSDWKYLGYFVDIFYEDNGGDKKLVSIMRRDDVSEPLTIAAGDFTFENNTLSYDVKDNGEKYVKTRKEHIPSSASVIYNQKFEYANVDSLFDIESGEITLLTDGKGTYDTVLIRDIRNVTVKINDLATDTVYTDGAGELAQINLDPYSLSYIKLGSSLSDRTLVNTQIKADDLISVIMSKDGGYIEIYVASGISAGVSKKADLNYGYIWNVYSDANEETAAFKLYNDSTEFVKVDFAKRVRVNGVSEPKMDAVSSFLDDNNNPKRQLIIYGTNEAGEINYIDTASKEAATYEDDGTLFQISGMQNTEFSKADCTFALTYPVAIGETRVMVIPASDKEGVTAEDFGMIEGVTKTTPFQGNTQYPVALYNTDIESPEIDFIVYQSADKFYGFLNYLLIDEITNVVSGDGEEVLKITGITAGKTAVTYYTSPDFAVQTVHNGAYTKENAQALTSGDLIAYNTNVTNNELTKAILLYDYSERTPLWGTGYEFSGLTSNSTYLQMGSIKKIYTNSDVNNQYMFDITELLGEGENINNKPLARRMPFYANKIKLLIYDGSRRTAKAYVGSATELVDAQGIGVGDDIMISTHGGYVIYPELFVVWK